MNFSQNIKPIEILLVEDSPSDAHLTIESFRHAKLQNNLCWVEDGESAMDYLRQQGQYIKSLRPDLILLDLNLPGMDGREVLEEIKSDTILQLIPVVVLTTSNDEQDVLRSYQLKANCYITKPVDAFKFLEIVKLIQDFWLAVVTLPQL